MSTNVAVGPVGADEERRGARRSLLVLIDPGLVIVGGERVSPDLGFAHEQAIDTKRAMARELDALSRTVADLQPCTTDDRAALQAALKLEDKVCLPALKELKDLGTALRADLSAEFVNKLRSGHFLEAEAQEEPALTFQETAAPIPWELMYEFENDPGGRPDWRRFWSFRVPITHWVHKGRTTEIRLERIFSAINEDLDFAEQEVALLTRQLPVELPHTRLAEALREQAGRKLGEQWLQAHPADAQWLKSFVHDLEPDCGRRPVIADEWKEQALQEILKGQRYDLIHFACHCVTSEETEYLSCLKMKIGGEPVLMKVAIMAPKLRRQLRNMDDPGPLVFLNACATARQGMTYQVPGFPDKWINDLGALAVLATICPVPDYFAHEFALHFYDTLFEAVNSSDPAVARNRYVAEALLVTRRYFMQNYNNPLGLAYMLYTIKDAHILVDFLSPGGS